ncbi:protein FAM3C [Labrus mixtus]|uniref:protein FAM3C n=1 Tax=Labrus mixtus TaxID=508554 RepID=UPI0029C02CFE|nr:protein FAM3C [Labrus mixtus]
MRYQVYAVFQLVAVVAAVLLLVWGVSITFDLQSDALLSLGFDDSNPNKAESIEAAKKCSLSQVCPPESFPFHIWSGAAKVVGPKICFNGKIIMSNVLNNVGPGINIVEINGERAAVEKCYFLNMESGDKDQILSYLREIKPGSIVLAASYIDVTRRMTDEMREIFEGMGSSMIKTLNSHDSWVFAGKVGMKEKSLFEKLVVSDPKTNIYDEWPRVAELGGCFPAFNEDNPNAPETEGKI